MQKRIMSLGELLVGELGLNQSVDTLTRWMAHYIAEQMEGARNANGDEKGEAEQRCFETILKLWQHRAFLPNGHRPFESYEPIFQLLEKLDPEKERPFYLNIINKRKRKLDNPGQDSDDVQKWLDIASSIDQTVRIWFNYVFEQAARSATDENTVEWLKNSVGLRDNYDTLTISRWVNDEVLEDLLDDLLDDDSEINAMLEEKRRELTSRISKLKTFSEFSATLLRLYEAELQEL